MSFKIKDFVTSKEEILRFAKKKGLNSIPEYCSSSGVPLLVAYHFIQEYLKERQETLEKFYGYKAEWNQRRRLNSI